MRKALWLAVAVAVMSMVVQSGLAAGIDEFQLSERVYVGGGFLYDVERFGGEWADIDFENTWGLDFKGGYIINEYLALEGLFRYHHEFKKEETVNADFGFGFGGVSGGYKATIKAYDFSVNAKAMLPLGALRPFVVAGLGYARFKGELSVDGNARGYQFPALLAESETKSGAFGRVGAGAMYFVSENVGVEGEIAYSKGFGDLTDAQIVSFNVGLLYAF